MKRYFSLDVESAGLVPGIYSMLSFGVCLVGKPEINFYRELKPISKDFDMDAMRVGCLGLRCLDGIKDKDGRYDARSNLFNPEIVLEHMNNNCIAPAEAMCDLDTWVRANSISCTPKCAAAPISYDFPFIAYYFEKFYAGKNPFGYSAEDINSMYRGFKKDVEAHIKNIRVREVNEEPHNSLSDAVYQSIKFDHILRRIGHENVVSFNRVPMPIRKILLGEC